MLKSRPLSEYLGEKKMRQQVEKWGLRPQYGASDQRTMPMATSTLDSG